MENQKPLAIAEFPLTEQSAKKIIRDLATNHTSRVKFRQHAEDRQEERSVTHRQILNVLKSRSSVITEGPYQEPNGSWKFNIEGMASGTRLRVVVALYRHEDDPSAFIVTVIRR